MEFNLDIIMVFIIISSIIKLDFTIVLAPNVFVSLILACFGTLPYTCRYTASSALCFKIKLPLLSWLSGRPTNIIMSEMFFQTIFLNFPLIWYNLFVSSKHIASHNLFPNILITWAYSYWSPLHTKSFFFFFFSDLFSFLPDACFYSFTFVLGHGSALRHLGLFSCDGTQDKVHVVWSGTAGVGEFWDWVFLRRAQQQQISFLPSSLFMCINVFKVF